MATTVINLSSLEGSNGFRKRRMIGWVFRSVMRGDVNGDGFDDVIVGASTADTNSGSGYFMFGKASGFDERQDQRHRDHSSVW